MQIFPIELDLPGTPAAGAAGTAQAGSFPQIFSSFIEEGRTEYCGLPEGFSALAPTNGTLDRDATALFKEALQKRKAPEEALEALEQINASGLPVTVGRIFAVLSGQSRATSPLEGEDRLNFTQLLGKWGFTRDETEEVLGLTDEGKTVAAWKRIAAKIKAAGGEENDAHVTEISALLKGLDMPEETRRQILRNFEKTDNLSLTGPQLETLLAPAAHKAAAREKAQESIPTLMREAMAQALEDGKRRERTDPVADTRGSRRSEQSQALMLDSVREKVGEPFPGAGLNRENAHAGLHQKNADAGRNRENTDTGRDRENADAQPEGKLRAERILALSPEKKAESVPSAEKPLGDAPDRLLQRIDTNGAAVSQGNRDSGAPQQTSAQDLNSLNRNVRQEIFSQVENGFLQNRQDGSHQLILKLNPQDLGQITLILSVKQGEVKALLRAEHGETATVLTEQLAELKASLEAQGLKVKELDVQTQLQNNEFAGQWNGAREHNLMQDAQERARMIRLSLLRRDTGGSPATPVTEQREQTGLHIVA